MFDPLVAQPLMRTLDVIVLDELATRRPDLRGEEVHPRDLAPVSPHRKFKLCGGVFEKKPKCEVFIRFY